MLSQDVVERALIKAQQSASHSWEYSTVFEALLEYHNPQLSVFHHDPFPHGQVPRVSIEEVEALRYVRLHIRTDTAGLSDGNGALDPYQYPTTTYRSLACTHSSQVRVLTTEI